MQFFVSEWEKLTSDNRILDIVSHCHIEFLNDEKPKQSEISQRKFNAKETLIIDSEIQKLLDQEVIKMVEFREDQFLSPIFIRPKKNGEYRLILNLKSLNEFIPYRHFKMDTFENALNLIKQDMFMCSVDIRHAYYSIKIADEDQIFLRFLWKGNIYQFTCCPNGISHGPLWFTKLMKPVYASLRNRGHISTGFIDDSLLGGQTISQCLDNLHDTISLMTTLGFLLNLEKSVLQPTKVITYLGFVIDSNLMIVYLPTEKKTLIENECKKLHRKESATIREVAAVIGLLVAAFPAVEFGRLHYRALEQEKIVALKQNRGCFDAQMVVTNSMKEDLAWWFTNIHSQYRNIEKGNPDVVIQTDSSTSGWGFVVEGEKGGGRWSEEEKLSHINVLELKAILFSLKALTGKTKGKHVKILSDSSTAVCYVTNFGGCRSLECNEVSKSIWQWCIKHNIWLTCTHIAGKDNEADAPSRQFNDRLEWTLKNDVFEDICRLWITPSIDLFASRLNHKIECYCSFKADPFAEFTDAFTLDWGKFECCYVFPPFSVISRCIGKIQKDRAQAIVVLPCWNTQVWWPALLKILVDVPRILPKSKNLLTLPHVDQEHPLWRKMTMIACRVSGDSSETKAFRVKLKASSSLHGDSQHGQNINHTYPNGYHTVIDSVSVKFLHL